MRLDRAENDENHHPGATVVITHHVRKGRQAWYDDWLNVIGEQVKASAGHLDWQVIRPIVGLTDTTTVVIRFDSEENLQEWMHSPRRLELIEQVRPLLSRDDRYVIHSGLEFWFMPPGTLAKPPVRWKQFVITWSAIFPLVLGVSALAHAIETRLGLSLNHYLLTLLITGCVVALMVYVVMPRYTKWVRDWLFR